MGEPKPKSSSVTNFIINWVLILGVLAFLAAIAVPGFVRSGHSSQNVCINNLRQIDGAKQQWALENHKSTNDVPTSADVAVYIKNGIFPECPQGGRHTIGAVDTDPVCSIPLHVLPMQ